MQSPGDLTPAAEVSEHLDLLWRYYDHAEYRLNTESAEDAIYSCDQETSATVILQVCASEWLFAALLLYSIYIREVELAPLLCRAAPLCLVFIASLLEYTLESQMHL